ncbi:MAG: hypothetical protein LUF26_00505, partial [Firmicutes bacterium]|nr:hypothetical protein [Bacillota bacterium]
IMPNTIFNVLPNGILLNADSKICITTLHMNIHSAKIISIINSDAALTAVASKTPETLCSNVFADPVIFIRLVFIKPSKLDRLLFTD